ncbi:MAG: cag pathogenicity island protein [Lachnospiraceae bacterium]|nr:cag pathogenicity island protein [Lachnospiraceae bacterium]
MAYDAKKKEYLMKYLEKLKEIRFRVKPEEYEKYEAAAKAAGYPSMRQFYIEALEEKVERLQSKESTEQRICRAENQQNSQS